MRVDRTSLKSWVIQGWIWYAHLCGVALISFLIAWGAVSALTGDTTVVRPLSPARDITPRVPVGGALAFSIDFERLESCAGHVIESFSDPVNPSDVIVTRRPTLSRAPKVYRNIRVNTQLPATLYPGRWRYTQTVESTCPTGKRFDHFATFDFEVYREEPR